jgi:hypothetical protein
VKLLIMIVALALVSTGAWSSGGYKCTIKPVVGITADGVIQDAEIFQIQVGKEFTIDRSTGRMIGELSNYNAKGSPVILDPGSKVQALKVLTVYGPQTYVDYLYLKEFVDSKEKPFYFTTGAQMYSGLCEHF